MQILSVRTFEGPNIYSHHPVIKVVLDLGAYEDVPSSAINGFTERLVGLLPGLLSHRCSHGYEGGFVERLREGTYLAHIFEHTVLELQCMAGYQVSFGKARSTGRAGIYHVVAGYRQAQAAVKAVYAAEKMLKAVLTNSNFDVKQAVAAIREAGEAAELGPSTAAICQAAKRRGIPVTRIDDSNLLILGYGKRQQKVWATVTSRTSTIAVDIACDKGITNRILAQSGIPVPYGIIVDNADDAVQALRTIGRAVAVKPLNGNQGKGVTLAITGEAEIRQAFKAAAQYDSKVLVEEFISGRQYRLCVVNGTLEAAAERLPAHVIGDGVHTVAQLVELANCDPRRGEGHAKALTKIKIDDVALAVLAKQQLSPQQVPPAGATVYIRENANLSTGGTAVDVTDLVHPATARLAERAARIIGLDIAGIDIVAENIANPLKPGSGAVIEVNAAPGIRMHHHPSTGQARDVAGAIVDYLFPDGADGRIPIFAVTGTNGKTTVTRMIGHIWQAAGYTVGMTTTDGIYINKRCIEPGDTTGPASARTILTDPAIDVAVLETARGGIMRGGLAFDMCDVGIITNITEDHLGQDGIEDLDDLAYVKSLVIETVKPNGFAILNADDLYVAALAARTRSEIVYVSTESDNIVVRRHLGVGGKAVFVKNGMLYAAEGSSAKAIVRVSEIPVTLGGVALHNVQNAVLAAAACFCHKVPISYIRTGLSTFEQNPGRLNLMPVRDFRVVIDYGHNPAGYQALINTSRRLGAARVVGVIAAPGDRRDDVIVNVGRIAGTGFDYLFIKEDNDLRGRQPGEVAALLRRGVLEAKLPPERIQTVLPEYDAVTAALASAQPGDLIVIFYEKYQTVLDAINQFNNSLATGSSANASQPAIMTAGVSII